MAFACRAESTCLLFDWFGTYFPFDSCRSACSLFPSRIRSPLAARPSSQIATFRFLSNLLPSSALPIYYFSSAVLGRRTLGGRPQLLFLSYYKKKTFDYLHSFIHNGTIGTRVSFVPFFYTTNTHTHKMCNIFLCQQAMILHRVVALCCS